MTLGSAIFFIAVVLLFWLTRDRWNWPRLLKIGGALTGLVILALAVGVLVIYLAGRRPTPQTEYWGIRLNQSSADVRFEDGLPDSVLYHETGYDSVFVYRHDMSVVWVCFSSDAVARIHVQGDLPSLQGISEYSYMEDVREKFGEPSDIKASEDGLVRRWYYPRYNVRFSFTENKVTSISVYDGASSAKDSVYHGAADAKELPLVSGWEWLLPLPMGGGDWLTAARQVGTATITVILMLILWLTALKSRRASLRREEAWGSLCDKLKSNANTSDREEEEKVLDSVSPDWTTLVGLPASLLILSILLWFWDVGRTAWKLGRLLLGGLF